MKKILNENKVMELILEAIDDYNEQISKEKKCILYIQIENLEIPLLGIIL